MYLDEQDFRRIKKTADSLKWWVEQLPNLKDWTVKGDVVVNPSE